MELLTTKEIDHISIEDYEHSDIIILFDMPGTNDDPIQVSEYIFSSYCGKLKNAKKNFNINWFVIRKTKTNLTVHGYYDAKYTGSYEDIKKSINNTDRFEHFIKIETAYRLVIDIYYDKNKYEIDINKSNEDYSFMKEFVKNFHNPIYYIITLCSKNNIDFKFLVTDSSISLHNVLKSVKSLSCSDEMKSKYYLKIAKIMNSDNLFKERLSELEDLEDKMLLLELYRKYIE